MTNLKLSEGNLEVKFITTQKRFAVPNTPFVVDANITGDGLSKIVRGLLKDDGNITEEVNFDFMIKGELLRSPLNEHIAERSISTETSIVIEFFESTPPPVVENCLMHDDWVSAVQCNTSWAISGCYDKSIHIWDLKSGKHLYRLDAHNDPVKDVSWVDDENSEEATFLSVSEDQNALLWKWSPSECSVTCLKFFSGHSQSIETVSVNKNKKKFATGGWDYTVKIWSVDESPIKELKKSAVKRIKLETDESDSINLHLPLSTFEFNKGNVSLVKWIDDDLLVASHDHTMKIVDVENGAVKTELVGNKCFLYADHSPLNGLIVAASPSTSIKLYDPRSQEHNVVKKTFTSHTKWVVRVKWSPIDPNQFVSASYDTCVKMWDIRSEKTPLYDVIGCDNKVLCADWSNPNYIVYGSEDCALRICTLGQLK